MKIIKSTFLILACFCISFSCNHNDQLNGTWQRIGDDLKGMQIEIVKNNSNYTATIVQLADNNYLLPFAIGDIKWKNIKLISENNYHYLDLKKYQAHAQFGSILESNYFESYMKLSGDTLKTRVFSKGNEIVGTSQIWVRFKN